MTGEKHKEIDMEGDWVEGNNEVCPEYPISATYDTSFLYIESTSQRSDITVRI